jgi:hypothetical protein
MPDHVPVADLTIADEDGINKFLAGTCDDVLAPAGFQNSATGLELGVYAARSYSLIRPPGTGWRLIRSWERPAAGWSGGGGCSWRLRRGRRPL